MRVGFIGLGNMGGPMCGHLVSTGFDVSAFDLDAGAVARAVESGARGASDLADCVRGAEVLITMLPAPPQVEQVLLGSSGAIAAMDRGSVAIDMSTSSTAVGARVLGPNTFVRPAWRGTANPPLGPAARRTFLIPVPPEQEQAALSRASGDPDVERAQMVPWPPDFP